MNANERSDENKGTFLAGSLEIPAIRRDEALRWKSGGVVKGVDSIPVKGEQK